MKKIAVITRTKNRPQLLRRCAENLSKQSMKDLQWVIVNDAGNREDVEDVVNYGKNLGLDIKLLHKNYSNGVAAAANHGMENSESELIHLHDDDDSVESNFYQIMSTFLDAKKYYGGVVCSTAKIVEKLTETHIIHIDKQLLFDSKMAMHIADLLIKNQFPPISFVFRRNAFDAVGIYDTSLPVLEDWDFVIRFLSLYDIGSIDEYLANYHHRLPNSTEKTPQTVTSGSALHEEFSAIIRNRYIRNANTEKIGFSYYFGKWATSPVDF
jgi:glycosyltransferase involved in cell wall biosynthesis